MSFHILSQKNDNDVFQEHDSLLKVISLLKKHNILSEVIIKPEISSLSVKRLNIILLRLLNDDYSNYLENTIVCGNNGYLYINSNKSLHYNLIGIIQFLLGRTAEAQESFNMALELFPRYLNAMENLLYTIHFIKAYKNVS